MIRKTGQVIQGIEGQHITIHSVPTTDQPIQILGDQPPHLTKIKEEEKETTYEALGLDISMEIKQEIDKIGDSQMDQDKTKRVVSEQSGSPVKQTIQHFEDFSVDEIFEILRANKIDAETASILREQEVNGSALLSLTESDLKSEGIKLGPRKNLLKLIQKFSSAEICCVQLIEEISPSITLRQAVTSSSSNQVQEENLLSSPTLVTSSTENQEHLNIPQTEQEFIENRPQTSGDHLSPIRSKNQTEKTSAATKRKLSYEPSISAGKVPKVKDLASPIRDEVLRTSVGVETLCTMEARGYILPKERQMLVRAAVDYLFSKNNLDYYPTPREKVDLAKQLIEEFPVLRDHSDDSPDGGYKHLFDPNTGTGFLETRLKTLRTQLSPSRRKYKQRRMPSRDEEKSTFELDISQEKVLDKDVLETRLVEDSASPVKHQVLRTAVGVETVAAVETGGYILPKERQMLVPAADDQLEDSLDEASEDEDYKDYVTLGDKEDSQDILDQTRLVEDLGSSIRHEVLRTPVEIKTVAAIEARGYILPKERQRLVRAAVDYLISRNNFDFYPSSREKVELAKQLIKEFPELRDNSDDCPDGGYKHLYDQDTCTGFIETRLKTLRTTLSLNKKKYKTRKMPNTDKGNPSLESETLPEQVLEEKVQRMKDITTVMCNKNLVESLLQETFPNRRVEIMEGLKEPADILHRYPRLRDYYGEMLENEFSMLILDFSEDGLELVKKKALKYLLHNKTQMYHNFISIKNDDVKAVAVVTELLPVLNVQRKGKSKESPVDKIRTYPHKDLIQYRSPDDLIPPSSKQTLLVTTGSRGDLESPWFLIINQEVFPLGNHFMRAFTILFKSFHIFNLPYPHQLKIFYNFFECIVFGMTQKSAQPSSTALRIALASIETDV